MGRVGHKQASMFSRVRTACFRMGWVGGGWGCDNVRWNFHTWSILHVFQGTQGMLWGGLGGGVGGDVITSVGTFTHGRYDMFSKLFVFLVFPSSSLLSFSTFLLLGTFELPVFSNQTSHLLGQGMRTCLNPMASRTTN